MSILLCLALACLAGAVPSGAEQKNIILATTTSTVDTGLFDLIIPIFEKKTGFFVKTIAVGSGQAMALGRKGEADVLLVHSPEDERKFMAEGWGTSRRLVMHNNFILAGPPEDHAGIGGVKSCRDAFRKIAARKALFLSRGDNSGTHVKEREIWKSAGIAPDGQRWYQQTGLGMGQTLSVASEKAGYTMADRSTYITLKKRLRLSVLLEGDPVLLNIYHVIEVNPAKGKRVNAAGAKALADFLVSKEVQEMIGRFGRDKYGSPLFFPDAGRREEDLKK